MSTIWALVCWKMRKKQPKSRQFRQFRHFMYKVTHEKQTPMGLIAKTIPTIPTIPFGETQKMDKSAKRPFTHDLEHDAAALFADLDGDPAGVAWAIRWARLHDAHDVKCHGYPTWAAWAVAVRHAALAGRLDAVGAGSRRNDSRLAVLAGAVGDEVVTQERLL